MLNLGTKRGFGQRENKPKCCAICADKVREGMGEAIRRTDTGKWEVWCLACVVQTGNYPRHFSARSISGRGGVFLQ